MSERELVADALLMGLCAGIVVWAVLTPYGWLVQGLGAYLVGRLVAIGLGRWA